MARRTGRCDQQHQRILIAIDPDFLDPQDMPRGFALHPQATARARVEMGKPGSAAVGQRFGIHERHHQHLASLRVERNGRQQPVAVETRKERILPEMLDEMGFMPPSERRHAVV